MKMSNVMVVGLGSVLCASLLTACADGRGTNGFKSYQFTKEEMAQNKLKRDGAKPKVETNQNNGIEDTAPTGDIGTGNSNPTATLPPPPKTTSGNPVFTAPGAGSHVIIEPGPATNPSGVVDLTAKVQDLNLTIDEELKDGKQENAVAKRLVKGITVTPNGTDTARTISINAIVVVGGEEVVMEATDIPVKNLKAEETLSNMLFTLTKRCDQKPVIVKNMLQAAAKCSDDRCLGIQVILSFETQDPARRAYAVFVVAPGRNAQGRTEWMYFKTNIGTPKTFQEAVNGMEACPAPEVTAPAPAPVGGERQGQAAPGTPMAPSKSSLDECSQKDAEGFSVCDSEGEKNRMRSARRSSENQPAPSKSSLEECSQKDAEGFSVCDSETEKNRMRAARRSSESRPAPAAPFTGDGSEHTPDPN